MELEHEVTIAEKELEASTAHHEQAKAQFAAGRQELESGLESVTDELSDVKLRLSASEGRVIALEDQLRLEEEEKKVVEGLCASIVSSLRRTIGFNPNVRRGGGQRGNSISTLSRPNRAYI